MRKMSLNIIPITLDKFKNLFNAIFNSENIDPAIFKELFDLCVLHRASEAPAWKKQISNFFDEKTNSILSR